MPPVDVLVFLCRPWRLQPSVVESHSAWWSVGCIYSLSVDADGPGSLRQVILFLHLDHLP